MKLAPLALVLLSTVALAACGGHEPAPAPAALAPLAAPLAPVERIRAAARTEVSGVVEAAQVATVSSRVAAMVTAVHVRLGDTVTAGQTLISIDPTAAEGQVAQARGALAQAEAAQSLARRNHERYRALAERQAASELELDLARMQDDQATGAVEQARGALAAATSVARDSRVVAPFAGRVAQRLIEVGDLAAPGRPLLTIESGAGRRLTLAVPESLARAAGLALGARVPLTIDARPDLGELAGEVVELSPGPDAASHSFTVRLELPTGDVPAGAAARAFLPGAEREAVLVPAAALIESGGLTLVVVRDASGQARSRLVSVGAARGDGRVEVLSGLAGDEVVALGLAAAPPDGTPLTESGS